MEILILDVFKDSPHRLSKDTNGGYGTAYKFSDSLFNKILRQVVNAKVDTIQPLILYLLSGFHAAGHKVEYKKIYSSLDVQSFPEADLVLVNCSIICWETELAAAKALEAKYPDLRIFLMGAFPSNNQHLIPKGIGLVNGEPEALLVDNASSLEGLRKGDVVDLGFVENLDGLPYPDFSLCKEQQSKLPFLRGTVASILAKRGCPYSCRYYCTYPLQQGSKVRRHSPTYIVALIESALKQGISSFIFRDPVFTIDKKWVKSFCNEIINRKLNIQFCAEFHLKDLTDELITLMQRAGLKLCYVGIESANDDVLNSVNRQAVKQDIQYENILKLERCGIVCKAMYILGLPTDTFESMKATIQYSRKIPSTLAQFSVFTPYPGTPAFKDFDITEKKLENFTQWDLVYRSDFDQEMLQKLLNEANQTFYFRAKTCIRVLRHTIKSILY